MSFRLSGLVAFGLVVLVSVVGAEAAGKRVALVVGNSSYVNVGVLANPVNDAAAMAAALREIGFEVTEAVDLDQSAFRKSLREFSSLSQGAETAMIYYAGHGVEVDGRNYLVPTDAALAQATDAEFEAIPLENIRTAVSGASKLRLVILDACRNNPFKLATKDGKRSVGRGLARVEPGANEIIAYAAREGTVASDGSGDTNSPYAKSLVKHLKRQGLEIRLLFGEVRDEVLAATGSQQEPFIYGTLGGQPIVLNGSAQAADEPAEQALTKKGNNQQVSSASSEAANAWVAVKDTTSVGVLKAYIAKFQGTVFADMASARLEELQGAAAPAEQPVVPDNAEQQGQPEQAEVDVAAADPQPAKDRGAVVGGVVSPTFITPVGKWAEGAALVDGSALWVAQSGERSIVAVDLNTRRLGQQVKVGRLPVAVEPGPDGKAVFSLQHTDKTIWMQPIRGRKGRQVAKLDECPQDMAIGDKHAFVLTWPDCSSNKSRLVRISPIGGAQAKSEMFGLWGEAVAFGHDSLWVAHPNGSAVSRVDPETLAVERIPVPGLSGWEVVDAGAVILVGGRQGEDNTRGLVVAIDPKSNREIASIEVGEMVQRIAVDIDRGGAGTAYAVGLNGRIFEIDLTDLQLKRDFTVDIGQFRPSDVLLNYAQTGEGPSLVIIAQQLNGENGAVLQFQPSLWPN